MTWKRIGRVLATPVTLPIRKLKEKAMVSVVFKVLRYAVAAFGGGVAATSDDTLMQAAGAIVTLGSIAVSIYKDIRDVQAKHTSALQAEVRRNANGA